MKTTAIILLVLPTVFLGMMFLYGPLDDNAGAVFGWSCFLSAIACLVCGCFLRRAAGKLGWACIVVGSLYLILLVVVPLLVQAIHPTVTRGGRRTSHSTEWRPRDASRQF